jgi:tyrosyl-tRNA synthetase
MSLPSRRFMKSLPYICTSCVRSQLIPSSKPGLQTRSITENFLKKTAEAADKWAMWAGEIRDGKRQSMLSILEERGYVNQIVG